MTMPVLINAEGCEANCFELFLDLVIVVAVAELASALSHHRDRAGLA